MYVCAGSYTEDSVIRMKGLDFHINEDLIVYLSVTHNYIYYQKI